MLLHGFCESSEIWEPLISHLSDKFELILPDLPGHGNSPLTENISTLSDISSLVIQLLNEGSWEKPLIMGHSMGGYVTLAVIAENPELFSGFGLIHSTAEADSQDKKANRDKAIAFISKYGAKPFFDNFVPSLYYRKGSWVKEVDTLVRRTPAKTLLRYSAMMRDRPDRLGVIESFHRNILLIGGSRDSFIAHSSLKEQAAIGENTHLHIFEDIGHLSMFEDPEVLSGAISDFGSLPDLNSA
jgi:pimeloyl-ACP methyl ester carboxylesterase